MFGAVGLLKRPNCRPSDDLSVVDTNAGTVLRIGEMEKGATAEKCESIRSRQWIGEDQLRIVVRVTGESEEGEVEKIFRVSEKKLIRRRALGK